ncbi:TolC family protein [Blastomonas marina]|uniref:TolC family protein n=1 Tax=Blastomonas marina TaxID=1867408 RepID=UPI002AC8D885|nr:TolC family protein [Blastomonas marina]WPZ03252.1 TolC family protein [Blastomonas marina]
MKQRNAIRNRCSALVSLIALGSLSACATYQPQPLDTSAAILATAPKGLVQDAALIERPFLAGKPVDVLQPLDRDALGLIALLYNPDLIALRKQTGVAEAQLLDARLIPDPSVGLSADRVISGPATAMPGTIAAQIAQDINSLRSRGARMDAAQEGLNQVRLDLAWAEWQVVEQVRLLGVRVSYLQRIAELAESNRAEAEDLLGRTLRAAGRGDIPPDQLQAARIAALDAADRAYTAQIDLTGAQQDLRRQLGVPPDFTVELAMPEAAPAAPHLIEITDAAIAERLDLAALRAGYASQEANVRQAIINQFPSLNLGFSVTRDSSDNGIIGALLDFTLPLWNRNRGQIAIERATREALRAEYDARLFAVRADLAQSLALIGDLQREKARLSAEIAPLRQFSDATARAAGRGDLPLATAMTARQSLRDKQLLLASVQQSLAEQYIALELASGIPWQNWNRP